LSRQDWLRALRDRLFASRLLSAFEMSEERMTEYLDVLARERCVQLFGYPSAVYLLCLHARKKGRDLRRIGVRVAFVTGEVLLPHQRELIADTMGCAVADGYGGRDSGFIAHECPDGGMHMMSDAVITEFLDESGSPVPPGEPGEIVVTDLYSEDAPFLRYATGDTGVASARACACGRPHPLLDRIEGRANDLVVAPDGRLINSLALVYPLRQIPGIAEYQIRQQHVDRFHVQIVRDSGFPPDAETQICAAWERLLRAPVHVTVEYTTRIKTEKSGKYRHVVSEVHSAASLERSA
jgi:phenylacetate-CoA ligase